MKKHMQMHMLSLLFSGSVDAPLEIQNVIFCWYLIETFCQFYFCREVLKVIKSWKAVGIKIFSESYGVFFCNLNSVNAHIVTLIVLMHTLYGYNAIKLKILFGIVFVNKTLMSYVDVHVIF